ncbi:MAG: PKD domain-containing protein [Mongoliitalea sp.]
MFFALLLIQQSAFSQVRVPFEPRAAQADPSKKNYRVNGDFLIIGNTNLTLEDYDDFKMNDNRMIYTSAFVGGHLGEINSSGAELKFPQAAGVDHACTEILFAGLYWTGRSGESRFVTITDQGATRTRDKQQIIFQGPRPGDRLNILVDENSIRFPEGLDNDNDVGIFVGFQDVTDYVKFHREGFYAGLGLALLQGTNYYFGGWSLVVVYENPNLPLKDITVFDGYAYVRGLIDEEFIIPIEGIQTQEEGNVRVKVGIMAGEGDVSANGDFFAIERGVGTNDFVRLSHDSNTPDNFFNSSINVGESRRIPSFKNNTGMDLATFFIDNPNNEIIGNNQTSLRFKYGTNWDTFVIYNLTIAVDVDEPAIEGFHQLLTINGGTNFVGTFSPGDQLGLTVDIRNLGSDRLLSNRIEMQLPRGLELVSASGENFQDPTTTNVVHTVDPSGASILRWDFGNLDPVADRSEVLARLNYTVRVTENCDIISTLCDATVSLDGFITGIAASSGQPYGEIPLIVESEDAGACLRGSSTVAPISIPLDVFTYLRFTCLNDFDEEVKVCNLSQLEEVPMEVLAQYFPNGTRFFDRNPMFEGAVEIGGNSGNPFPPLTDNVFFANFNENEIRCYIPFLLVDNILEVEIRIDKACESTDGRRAFETEITGFKPSTRIFLNDALVDLASIQRLFPGDYVLRVVDGGCVVEKEFTIRPFEGFGVELINERSIFENVCPGGREGLLVFEVTGNVPFEKLELTGFPTRGGSFVRSLPNPAPGEYEFGALPSGRYEWRLVTVDGCVQEGQTTIVDSDAFFIPAAFEYEGDPASQFEGYLIGERIQFTIIQPTIYTSVQWDFGDGTTSTLDNPTHTYQSKGIYTIRLRMVDINGCTQEVLETIEISAGSLRMPTAFSPSGDERNRHFFPVAIQLESLTFRVFNRWGEMVFFTTDINSKGWDGTHQGREAPAGTYIYQLDYKIIGEPASNQKGSFILIR